MKSQVSEENKKRWQDANGWQGYYLENGSIILEDRVKAVLGLLENIDGATYLDIGCSEGTLTSLYAEKLGATDIHGVDICDPEIACSKGITAKSLDLNKSHLQYPDSYFNCVTMCETLEHLVETEFVLSEIYRVLKPGGVAVLSVPRIDSKLTIISLLIGFQPPGLECSLKKRYASIGGSEPSGHVSLFTKKAFVNILESAGFKIEKLIQKSMSSGWKLTQKAKGKKIGKLQLLAWFFYDLIPFKQDVMIITIRKY